MNWKYHFILPVLRSTATRRVGEKVVARPLAAIEIVGRAIRPADRQAPPPDRRSSRSTCRCCRYSRRSLSARFRSRARPFAGWCGIPRSSCRSARQRRGPSPCCCLIAGGREAFAEGRADQTLVAHHGGRRLPADFAGGEVGLDTGWSSIGFQVHHAIVAEDGHALAGLGVQLDQPIARGDIDMRASIAVAPVGRPRPESWRGAAAPRAPSFSPCTQFSSPVSASSATTARREPAVA